MVNFDLVIDMHGLLQGWTKKS